MGGEVVRTIDSIHPIEPWHCEAELIKEIGRLAEGTGPLTNAQTYALSSQDKGIEHRKYASEQLATGTPNGIPLKFRLRNTRLMVGPKIPPSRTSVSGKIFTVVEANPGITGEQLISLLRNVDFSRHKSAYTQGAQVSASWLVGYIEGAYFLERLKQLQDFHE
jgi:hypothetical protein